jgi:methyltransferase (TIGR00027 family)
MATSNDNGVTFSAYFVVNVRTHYIDAALKRAAAEGATQVVILGAGYDARALRFHTPGVRFFEVDHPATQADKRARLEQVGAVPDHVRYAPIDSTRRSWRKCCRRSATTRSSARSSYLEGVTMYVAEAGNGATLDFIRKHSAPGSRWCSTIFCAR